MSVAVTNFEAALSLAKGGHNRSAVSRAYYAAFAAVHSLLLHLDATPRPEFGTWAHATLPGALRAALSGRMRDRLRADPTEYSRMLAEAYSGRQAADYNPQADVSSDFVRRSLGRCGALVRLAEGVVR